MSSRSRKPRIALFGYKHDARTGMAQFGRRLATELEARADVRLIGYRKLYPEFTGPGGQWRDPSRLVAGVPGEDIAVPWLPGTWRATSEHIEAFDPDLLVVQWWNPFFGPSVRSIVRRARRKGVRTVIMCHNDRPHEPMPFWRTITRAALRQADVLGAFNPSVGEGLRSLAPGAEVFVSPLPPEIPRTVEAAGAWEERLAGVKRPTILFFGQVRPYKGLEDLIAALPLVRRRVDASLVIAGRFVQPLERFRRQVRTLGVEEHVRFIPDHVPDEEVPGLFRRCDVVALPYRSATSSGVLVEAAQSERPVVVTRVGALPEMVGEHGVVVAPRDPASLADGLVRALEDPPPPPPVTPDAWERWRDFLIDCALGAGEPAQARAGAR